MARGRRHVAAAAAAAAVAAAIAVVAAPTAAAAGAAAVGVRGVPPSLAAAYAGTGGVFKCLNGGGAVPFGRVNDDYCDCADGSDEPGTSACAGGRFYCANAGYRAKFVLSSVVNDGVCDCCDGADEYGGRAACGNTCEVDGAEWRAATEARLRALQDGAALRAEYVAAGGSAAATRATALAAARAAAETARAAREAADKVVEVEEAEETRVTEGRRAEAATKSSPAAVATALQLDGYSREALVELLLEVVRTANASQALVSAIVARLPAEAPTSSVVWTEVADDAAAPYRSDPGERARAAAASARTEETRADGELRTLTDEDGTDFGPDAVFYKLKGRCFDVRVNQYTYSACPFGSAKQDHTSLGSWSGWDKAADGTVNYGTMSFTGGASCWNGPARSLKLTFECGATDALLGADEPEKCTYASRFSTPAACTPAATTALQAELSGKDEL